MQAQGIDVMKLNTGNPAAFGFPLPDSIRAALEGREAAAVPYCDFQGMGEAREAIVRYETGKGIDGLRVDDVFIGNGVSEVVNFALMPLLNHGDEVLIPANTLRADGDLFLCGMTPMELSRKLGVPVRVCPNDGVGFLTAMLGVNTDTPRYDASLEE